MNDIPPRDFGKLEATVEQLENRLESTVKHFESKVGELTTAVQDLTAALNQAKGGWKLLAAMGGLVSFATVVALKFFGFLKGY
jgi:tetrahydromethanopterin S-methyltransferase subunit B